MKKSRFIISLGALLIFAIAFTGSSVSAGSLVGINDDSDELVLYDTDALGISTVLLGNLPNEIESLAYAGNNIFYGIQSFNSTSTSKLYKFVINEALTSASISQVGGSFNASNIDSMEYVDGFLYTMDNQIDELIKLDLNGNIVERKSVSGSGIAKVEGMAYKDGILYVSDTRNDGYSSNPSGSNDADSSLFKVDISGGLSALTVDYIGQIGYGQVEALTFADDILYGRLTFIMYCLRLI